MLVLDLLVYQLRYAILFSSQRHRLDGKNCGVTLSLPGSPMRASLIDPEAHLNTKHVTFRCLSSVYASRLT